MYISTNSPASFCMVADLNVSANQIEAIEDLEAFCNGVDWRNPMKRKINKNLRCLLTVIDIKEEE